MPLPRAPRKLVLVVIDGLTPAMLERGIDAGFAPTLARLAEAGPGQRLVGVLDVVA